MKHKIQVATFSEIEPGVQPPDELELIPIGQSIKTNDGREFIIDDPQAIIDNFHNANSKPQIDIEHKSELAKLGEFVPAEGWVEELFIRNNSIWCRVDWTGGDFWIKHKKIRYVSPALESYEIRENLYRVTGISSVGLTNDPALKLMALFSKRKGSEEPQPKAKKEPIMTKALCKALGLQPEASEDSLICAVDKLKEDLKTALASSEKPDATKFVPIQTFNQIKEENENLKNQLASSQEASIKERAEGLLDKAAKEGKIAPNDKGFYADLCSTQEGCDKFEEFIKTKSPVVSNTENLSSKKPGDNPDELSAEQISVCSQLGMTKEEFLGVENKDKGDQ